MRISMITLFSIVVIGAVALAVIGNKPPEEEPKHQQAEVAVPPDAESLVVGGGCFWCLEPQFELLKGVYDAEVGYAGGEDPNVTYQEICSGTTGHAEVLKVFFDPKKITRHDLLSIFLTIHDPTTLNRQGPDSGTQYRSVIFYANEDEKKLAEEVIAELTNEEVWKDPIVTTVEPLKNYVRAEEYHQDYYEKFEDASLAEKMGMNSGYCNIIIQPKVSKFRKQFDHLLKE